MAIRAFEQRRQQLADEGAVEQQRGAGYDANAGRSRAQYQDIVAGGQGALNEYARSAIDAGMPGFQKALQGVRESSVQRGVGLGGLGTSYEGDLASAFERNITDAVGAQAMNLYGTRTRAAGDLYDTDENLAEGSRNRYLDLLSGQVDRDTGRENASRKRRAGLFGTIGSVAGAAAGFIPGFGQAIGGPAGGAAIGGEIGQGIGG